MNRRNLLRRPSDGAAPAPWFRIQNKADDSSTAQIDIYDEIDWFWGVSAVDFRNQLKALGDGITTIDLHINSPGGDVYEAIAIMNTLRQHDARVVTTIDGVAASSAGFIAVGASDELIVAKNAEIMAHLPWTYMVGDANEMRKAADDLERIGKNIASIFADRAGGSVDEWMDVLTAETWWSAVEAVDAGIADQVLDTKQDSKNATKNRFDLSVFNHAGRSKAPAPRNLLARNETPQPVEVEGTNGKEPFVATLSESALKKLGLDAGADEAAVDVALDAALAGSGEGSGGGDPAGEPSIDEAMKVAAKFGMTVVDKAQFDSLTATVADLTARRDQSIKDANETVIQNALKTGRIGLPAADTWRAELAKNPEGIRAVLETLAPSSAVPVDEIGHGVTREDGTHDAEQATVFNRITGKTFGKDA